MINFFIYNKKELSKIINFKKVQITKVYKINIYIKRF